MTFEDESQSVSVREYFKRMSRIMVAVGGFSSDVGKTTLMCELLRAFPGWEAIKTTRGHYRSCGKSLEACCVSHLLSDEPLIRSGREATYAAGKDTGRYWDAGASNVHWAIVTDAQVEQGIKRALERVRAPGVFIEGNSFQQFVKVDLTLMVTRPQPGQLKQSARRALRKTDALYLFDDDRAAQRTRESFHSWRATSAVGELVGDLPIYTREDLPELIGRLKAINAATVV
jgi:molybdopterin-guanine dinucleotide biosynthesis protein